MSNERPDLPAEADELRPEEEARRTFLMRTGRFAAVTAPTITLLLGTSLSSRAIAKSVSSKPGHAWGDKKWRYRWSDKKPRYHLGDKKRGFGWGDKKRGYDWGDRNHVHTGRFAQGDRPGPRMKD